MAIDFSKVDPGTHPIHGKNWQNRVEDRDNKPRGILRTPALHEYIMETSVYPREHKALKGLRNATDKHAWKGLATSADEGQFLGFLLKLLNAKNTIELGVFTGYSLLCTALALPEDGKVIGVDINRKSYEIGVPFIEEAGVAHKIDFREGKCMDTLKSLLAEDKHHGFFDFIFVDADKENLIDYHEASLKLVRPDGIIAYDNTLWGGSVADANEESTPKVYLHYKPIIQAFNKFLATDARIDISHLSISDGITLCRRIV